MDRVKSLETWREGREDARVEDIRLFMEKIGEVHEKVNDMNTKVGETNAKLAGLNGKLIAFGLATTGAGAIVVFLLGKL